MSEYKDPVERKKDNTIKQAGHKSENVGPDIGVFTLAEHAHQNSAGQNRHQMVHPDGFSLLHELVSRQKTCCPHDGCGSTNGQMGGFVKMSIDQVAGCSCQQEQKRACAEPGQGNQRRGENEHTGQIPQQMAGVGVQEKCGDGPVGLTLKDVQRRRTIGKNHFFMDVILKHGNMDQA